MCHVVTLATAGPRATGIAGHRQAGNNDGRCRGQRVQPAASREQGAVSVLDYTLSIDEPVQPGTLYVVATPLGNLGDVSARAVHVLAGVDHIVAEDTRHSARLLRHLGLSTPLSPLHEHNERARTAGVVQWLQAGSAVALISDAGTPLISDPGYPLVNAVVAAGLPLVPVPGPAALIAALCVSGLPTDRFGFEGFLPARAGQRRQRLQALSHLTGTRVFYEAPHRIEATLTDMVGILGAARRASVARELTKRHESLYHGTLGELYEYFCDAGVERRGEFVICVAGAASQPGERVEVSTDAVLETLLEVLPLGRAVATAVRITGARRNVLYQRALELSRGGEESG